jgi:subtilase family serine protease
MKAVGAIAILTLSFAALSGVSLPQARLSDRIRGQMDERSMSVVPGHLHPRARPEFDQGRLDSLTPLHRMTVVFKRTETQQANLNALLQEQQDPSSPNYHLWLTPEEFGDRFGLSAADLDKVASWLQSQGFTIDGTARGRSWITFSGAGGQVDAAFRTELHEYSVNGVPHYAAAKEPSVPSALVDVVSGFSSLHDFGMKSRVKPRRAHFTSSITGDHFLVPDDIATIYDIRNLFMTGNDGTGQKIAVMGQTDIALSDIAAFRSASGLPPKQPAVILVPGSGDPGFNDNDVVESDIDLEWAGAAAPNADLIYVNSGNGAFDSLQYTVDQKLAPIVVITYGDCENNFPTSDINFLAALGQQANAQGMTIVAAAGDAGATDCDGDFSGREFAKLGLAVDTPASLPSVTAVGGTTLFDVNGHYWSATSNANGGSALFYIPEVPWNDTLAFAENGMSAGGGGRSAQFTKPNWQVGPGVPKDGARDVPDIALTASDYDGYLICSLGSCVNGFRARDSSLFTVNGTSLPTPIFAGIVALINQRLNTPQGNVNPGLYKLAQTEPAAFHDVATGGNWMPCQTGTTDCPHGGLLGYSAGQGYDLVTGLGSIDAFRMVTGWPLP